jgi:hypothetical protein
METEGSVPCSQELTTGPYPESHKSSPYHPIILLWYTLLSSYLRLGLPRSLSCWLFHQNPVYIRLLAYACYMHCPSNLELLILIILGEEYKLYISLSSFLNLLLCHPSWGTVLWHIAFTQVLLSCLNLCTVMNWIISSLCLGGFTPSLMMLHVLWAIRKVTSGELLTKQTMRKKYSLTHGAEPFLRTRQLCSYPPPSATWGRAMPWWQGTHLTWKNKCIIYK